MRTIRADHGAGDDPGSKEEFLARLARGETVAFCARGRSMRPFYPDGTMFWLRQVPAACLRPGDLILIHWQDRFVLHRLLGLRGERLCTKGDWLDEADALWPPQAARARAVAVLWGGTVRDLDRPTARAAARAAAAASVPAGKVLGRLRALRRRLPGGFF